MRDHTSEALDRLDRAVGSADRLYRGGKAATQVSPVESARTATPMHPHRVA